MEELKIKCLEYLKNHFLNFKPPIEAGVSENKMTEEDWERMPQWNKDLMCELVLGFNTGNALMDKIRQEYDKKRTDQSFGMIVKDLIKQNK